MTDTDKIAAEMRAGLEGLAMEEWHVYSEPEVGLFYDIHYGSIMTGTTSVWGKGREAEHIARCNPVNIKALLDERAADKAELEHFKRSGIIEVSVRNPNVADYMRHWEGRAEKAEASLEANEALMQEMVRTFEKIIDMNVQYALDRYGRADKAEDMACVKVSRAIIAKYEAQRGAK